jgi:hypothetical protein
MRKGGSRRWREEAAQPAEVLQRSLVAHPAQGEAKVLVPGLQVELDRAARIHGQGGRLAQEGGRHAAVGLPADAQWSSPPLAQGQAGGGDGVGHLRRRVSSEVADAGRPLVYAIG